MSTMNMVSYIKNLLPNYLVLIKIGNFYETYNDDAKILSYLFNYKLKTIDHIYSISGFPLVAIHKVKSLLEKKEISYILIDKKHNYEEIEKMDYKRKNKYNLYKEEAMKYIDKIARIEKIRNTLLNDITKLSEIERILYEER